MPKINGFYNLYGEKLNRYVGKPIKLLEIGVQDGSSIAYWRKKSPEWDVWGMDIDKGCAGDKIIIGPQEDPKLLEMFEGFDVIIDDGGHRWKQQVETFQQLFPKLAKGGLYVIEDLHTSFWEEFGGYKTTCVDFLTSLVPDINHKEANCERLGSNQKLHDRKIAGIEFYPSIVFIWKE
jgi:hypothetical protein